MSRMEKERCKWVPKDDQLYIEYHDHEWGRPTYDDRELFEMLSLEGAQAGLSWITILRRRENYRKAFANFEADRLIHFDDEKITELMLDEGIIRNKLKIRSVIKNAKAFLRVQEEFGSFNQYIWKFVGGEPINNHWKTHDEVPSSTKESEQMSKDLKKRGFSFVGPTICYAFMQATGMVNDHTQNCFLSE
ncbi:DNA-3-methyladenine glycosylase I [Ornithinibacillus sp. L9]|uniref:DNA-3-methyladenine glycosylase I n=1 Tax=Ornithinibacillus caprae TaxID=2678566 RepID=A0A6N8FNZ0_9BACI|nr:DNA-3-methyladenine glycosylase I [Ornithinibacillus caprae]MUK89827.1 DNA-3-methyladenine glycosylase I [Ornithinibacillus caprae]